MGFFLTDASGHRASQAALLVEHIIDVFAEVTDADERIGDNMNTKEFSFAVKYGQNE
jgi:hypothetical protein